MSNHAKPDQLRKLDRAVRMVKAGYPTCKAAKVHHVSERTIRKALTK